MRTIRNVLRYEIQLLFNRRIETFLRELWSLSRGLAVFYVQKIGPFFCLFSNNYGLFKDSISAAQSQYRQF
jgi:hypothetical protein